MGDVKLNSSGGGSVTLTPPSTASNYTVTLPAATSTLVDTTSTQTLTNKTIASLVTTGTATFGGIVNTGSTGQVQFPATQNPSSDANTLDDYEEGTWTPSLLFGGTNGVSSFLLLNGTYTKIGNTVTVRCYLCLQTKSSATGSATLSGLPFPVKAGSAQYATAYQYMSNAANISPPMCYLDPGNNRALLGQCGASGFSGLTNANFNNSTDIVFESTYLTD